MNRDIRLPPSNVQNLIGKRFGELTVIEFSHIGYNHVSYWLCQCDCGFQTVTTTSKLKSGHTKTCGHANITNIKRKPGYYPARDNPRLYIVWRGMKDRCNNPKHSSYSVYGGKGVSICDEWKVFGNFCEWALANGYDENAPTGECTIDRIDVNRNYEPSNCRWVNKKVQANNKSNNRLATIEGKTDTITNWARTLGLKQGTVAMRLMRGDTPERALRPVPPKENASTI